MALGSGLHSTFDNLHFNFLPICCCDRIHFNRWSFNSDVLDVNFARVVTILRRRSRQEGERERVLLLRRWNAELRASCALRGSCGPLLCSSLLLPNPHHQVAFHDFFRIFPNFSRNFSEFSRNFRSFQVKLRFDGVRGAEWI